MSYQHGEGLLTQGRQNPSITAEKVDIVFEAFCGCSSQVCALGILINSGTYLGLFGLVSELLD